MLEGDGTQKLKIQREKRKSRASRDKQMDYHQDKKFNKLVENYEKSTSKSLLKNNVPDIPVRPSKRWFEN